jgi:hypothetical protein
MSGMPVPSWTNELKQKFYEEAKKVPPQSGLEPIEFHKIDVFSTHFAEWSVRESDLIVHFFPREGKGDQWSDGHYLTKCRECKAEVPVEVARARKPCPHCGHLGLIYVPGRGEDKSSVSLEGTEGLLKQAIDKAWMGDAAVELIKELGAFVVQLQGAKNTAALVGEKFIDKICEEYDRLLEADKTKP